MSDSQSSRFQLFEPGEPRVGVVIGTGPSFRLSDLVRLKQFRWFGVNLAGLGLAVNGKTLDAHLACNVEFFDHYALSVRISQQSLGVPSWIAVDPDHPERARCAARRELQTIGGRWAPGLSTDPAYIHYHHGAGPQMINLALHYGCQTLLLLGWDMKYGEKRHFFGEYPKPLQHYPKTGPGGELSGLIAEMETIKPDEYGIDIVNVTPGSALTCFRSQSISAFLSDSAASKE